MAGNTQIDKIPGQTEQAIAPDFAAIAPEKPSVPLLKKVRGSFLLVIGYLLSPLSFWNDLFFNLPVAYCFGYMFSWFSPDLFLPCTIAGYWLSNVAGILLMQAGLIDVFQEQSKERDLKKELLTGLVTSTIYSVIIFALVQFKIIDTPALPFN